LLLTINSGSSSIRFAFHRLGDALRRTLYGKIDRIGLSGTILNFHDAARGSASSGILPVPDGALVVDFLLEWLENRAEFESVRAVGHRAVHGMQHADPERLTDALLRELHEITPYDPDHLPREIALVESIQRRHPKLPQVMCFDTAFHRTMPNVAKMLPIPRRYYAKGVQRYGFHGLSYAYMMEELERIGEPSAKHGRVILAHLGSGASMAAVRDGLSIDTSMGFTPVSGLVMSTRSGDLDPGVVGFLARTENMTAIQFVDMANHDSGLLGLSETSSDLRDLLKNEASDQRAADAVGAFCYAAQKCIGAFAAVLGGIDMLAFAGGIGENAPSIRERLCAGLEFLGVKLDRERNATNMPLISADGARIKLRIVRTDEEIMIARSVARLLKLSVS
jgi:acetate kinase